MQLSVGSKWIDHEGNTFIIDAIGENGAETWVTYYGKHTNTYYRCLTEAFTHRFSRIENDSRS